MAELFSAQMEILFELNITFFRNTQFDVGVPLVEIHGNALLEVHLQSKKIKYVFIEPKAVKLCCPCINHTLERFLL